MSVNMVGKKLPMHVKGKHVQIKGSLLARIKRNESKLKKQRVQ